MELIIYVTRLSKWNFTSFSKIVAAVNVLGDCRNNEQGLRNTRGC
jgi:hypothetical protein